MSASEAGPAFVATTPNYGGPYTVRSVRALRGGGTDSRDIGTPFRSFHAARRHAENTAAFSYDEGDFAVVLLVIDGAGVPVHQARGEWQEVPSEEVRHQPMPREKTLWRSTGTAPDRRRVP